MEFKFSGKITLKDFIHRKRFNNIFLLNMGGFIFSLLVYTLFAIRYDIRRMMETDNLVNMIHGNELRDFSTDFYTLEEIISGSLYIRISLVIIPLLIIAFIITLIITSKAYKKMYYQNKLFCGTVNYSITENEISMTSESDSLVLSKDNIAKITYYTDVLFIHANDETNLTYIILRNFFENPRDFKELSSFMEKNYTQEEKCGGD